MAIAISDLVFIDSAGYHVADYPTFLQFFQEQYQLIYGADIYLGADSQDGQIVAVQAQAAFDTATNGQGTYLSFSPTTAQGVGLSRNVKINGLAREVAGSSTVILTIIGQAGTQITNGIAVDTLNQQWALPALVTIPFGGSVTVTAISVTLGAINAAPNTVTSIFTPTQGWQSVNNVAAATPGAPVETDSELRTRQAASVANPSLTVLEGTYGAIANVPGVQNLAVWENFNDAADANGQLGHSILAVVNGGDLTAVADAIQIHKTPGTNPWSGPTFAGHNQSVSVADSHGVPVQIGFFQPPNTATIGIEVTLVVGTAWATAFETTIAAQLAAYINALGIGAGVQFGGEVRLIPLYNFLYVPGYLPSMYTVSGLRIKKNAGSFGTADLSISYVELPTTSAAPGTNIIFIT